MPDRSNATEPPEPPQGGPEVRAIDPVEMEQRLLGLHAIHECRVIVRGLEPTRLTAYVVPSDTVRPVRINEWMAVLRKEVTDARGGAVCDLVAISRLPLTEDGQVDEEALCRLPVLDDGLTRRWEIELKG